jgi:hypothetical protein
LAEERDYLMLRARARGAAPVEIDREVERYLRRHPDGFYSPQVRSMRTSAE